MKLHYDQETDSLSIDLNSRPSADSPESLASVHGTVVCANHQ
jgi:hypothetical protein